MKQEQTHGILNGLRVFSSKFDQLRFFISNYTITARLSGIGQRPEKNDAVL